MVVIDTIKPLYKLNALGKVILEEATLTWLRVLTTLRQEHLIIIDQVIAL
jgi:hypothetical protein